MAALNTLTLTFLIIGGINWGLVGLANTDLVASIFGGPQSTGAKVVYVLVGLSAVWQLVDLIRGMSGAPPPRMY